MTALLGFRPSKVRYQRLTEVTHKDRTCGYSFFGIAYSYKAGTCFVDRADRAKAEWDEAIEYLCEKVWRVRSLRTNGVPTSGLAFIFARYLRMVWYVPLLVCFFPLRVSSMRYTRCWLLHRQRNQNAQVSIQQLPPYSAGHLVQMVRLTLST